MAQGINLNFYLKDKDSWILPKLKQTAKSARLSQSELITRAIIEYWDNHPEYDMEVQND